MPTRSTTTTINTNIAADRLVEVLGATAAGATGATGVLAVSEGGPSGATGTTSCAADVLTGAAGVAAGFRGRADDCVR